MIDFSKALTNPWVWGAGVILGVLVLSASSRGGSPHAGSPTDPYALQGTQANLAAYNTAAFAAMTASADQAAATSRSNSANNLARDLKVIDAITNSNGVWATVETAANESAAGITKARIAAQTSLALDRGQNEVRRDQIYVAGQVSNFATQLAAQTAQQQTAASLKATTQANQINGDNSFWNGVWSLVGTIGKVLIPLVF